MSKTLMQGESLSSIPFDGDYSSNYTPDRRSHFRESGVVEGDCLICHMPGYRMDRRNVEISKRNYGWAATAGAQFGEIKGAVFTYRDPTGGQDHASRNAVIWNFSKRPSVEYRWGDADLFTKEGKLKGSQINKSVTSKNCLLCHGEMDARKAGTHYAASYDVHITAGFQCADCHSLVGNTKAQRLRHQIAKGWTPGVALKRKLDGVGMKTCVGCHLDGQYRQVRKDMPKEAKDPSKVHKEKFPRASFHFYLLHCSACHATGQPARAIYLSDVSRGEQVWYGADKLEKLDPQSITGLAAEPWQPWVMRYERIRGEGDRYIPYVPQVAQWFGEKLQNGEVRPISLRYVREAAKGVRGLTAVEVRNDGGGKVKEPTVATESDIRLMVKALSDMGFKNVAFVSDRIYGMQQGKVAALNAPSQVRGPTFPAYHKGAQWFGEKQENGEIKPISLLYVLQAARSMEGISMTERRNERGRIVMEPDVKTGRDIRLALKALTDMGYKDVVFISDRLYKAQQGRLRSFEIPKTVQKPVSASYFRGTKWFGEELPTGEMKPISARHVNQALSGLKGLTVVEIKNSRGDRMMEPTVATERDILLMIKALSDAGFKNIVLVANRVFEIRQGRLVSREMSPVINNPSYPVFHNVLPVEKKKTYGAKGSSDGCLDCHGEKASFFTKMKVQNTGRFLKDDYPIPKEPNAEPQMYEWGIRSVPAYE